MYKRQLRNHCRHHRSISPRLSRSVPTRFPLHGQDRLPFLRGAQSCASSRGYTSVLSFQLFALLSIAVHIPPSGASVFFARPCIFCRVIIPGMENHFFALCSVELEKQVAHGVRNGFRLTHQLVAAVSYTHLDVYKRQKLADELPERRACQLLYRLALSDRPPCLELFNIFEENHSRPHQSGPSQGDPRKTTDFLINESRALGLAEMLAVGREPRTCLLYTSRCV